MARDPRSHRGATGRFIPFCVLSICVRTLLAACQKARGPVIALRARVPWPLGPIVPSVPAFGPNEWKVYFLVSAVGIEPTTY